MRLVLAPMQRSDPEVALRGKRYATRNSDEYTAWLEHAALLVRATWGRRPKLSPGPVLLEVTFVLAPPKANAKALAGLWCAKRPDLDRYVHAIQDAITQARNVWDDDNQVAKCVSGKRYAFENEPPSILVEASNLPLLGPTGEPATVRGGTTRSAVDQGGARDGGARSAAEPFPAPIKGAFR